MESHTELKTINLTSLGTPTQIGLATKTLDNQPAVTFFFLAEY